MAEVKIEVVDSLEEDHAPPHKHQKKVGICGFARPASQYSPLDEPSSLWAPEKKSPSLLELNRFKFSQGNMPKVGNCSHSNKESKCGAAPVDKMKAFDFPASIIKLELGRDGQTVVNIDNGGVKQLKALDNRDQIMGHRSSMSMSDFVSRLESRISEQEIRQSRSLKR